MIASPGLGSLRDQAEVRRIVETYSDAINRRDRNGYGVLFADDAVWICGPPIDRRVEGREAISRYLDETVGGMDLLVQMMHNIVVTVDGDVARSRATVQEIGRAASGIPALSVLALYDDELRRSDDSWMFTRRRFSILYYDHEVPRGKSQRPPAHS